MNPTRVVSFLGALQTRLGQTMAVSFAPGYVLQPDQDATGLADEALALAQPSQLVVLFLGLPPSYEAEGRDRTTIELPADQVALVRAVAAVNPRVIVALSNGSAVLSKRMLLSMVEGVVWVDQPAALGGGDFAALCVVLSGVKSARSAEITMIAWRH